MMLSSCLSTGICCTAIPGLKITAIFGIALWAGGIMVETTTGRQKLQWMAEKREEGHPEDSEPKVLWG